MAYWLIKSEPNTYPYRDLERDEKTVWDGVRNFEARNNLRAMRVGDLAFFYHSNIGKEIVGVARVIRAAYPDPTAPKGEDWSVVDIAPHARLSVPVTLEGMKADAKLRDMEILKKSRLSVSRVTPGEWKHVLSLAKTKL